MKSAIAYASVSDATSSLFSSCCGTENRNNHKPYLSMLIQTIKEANEKWHANNFMKCCFWYRYLRHVLTIVPTEFIYK
jgi:hypothetical protein